MSRTTKTRQRLVDPSAAADAAPTAQEVAVEAEHQRTGMLHNLVASLTHNFNQYAGMTRYWDGIRNGMPKEMAERFSTPLPGHTTNTWISGISLPGLVAFLGALAAGYFLANQAGQQQPTAPPVPQPAAVAPAPLPIAPVQTGPLPAPPTEPTPAPPAVQKDHPWHFDMLPDEG